MILVGLFGKGQAEEVGSAFCSESASRRDLGDEFHSCGPAAENMRVHESPR